MRYALESFDLNVSFGKNPILWDLSLKVPSGLLVGILGPNGAGKSTFLKAALGLVQPLSGKIDLLGAKLSLVRNKIAYVPQRESVDWDFPITAFEVVLMGRFGNLGLFGHPRKADREAAMKALESVGMAPFANRQISELSGGQQQRLFIARALVQNPDLFLLDEPFAGVDLATEQAIMALLKREKAKGKSIFIVHHDLPSVRTYFDWVILLNKRLISSGPVESTFTEELLDQTFGKIEPLFSEAASLSLKSREGE